MEKFMVAIEGFVDGKACIGVVDGLPDSGDWVTISRTDENGNLVRISGFATDVLWQIEE